MPVAVHIPKRISTDLIREKLGDAEAERYFVKIFGSMLMPQRVPVDTLQKTLDIVEGRANGHAAHLIPLAFRAWFAEQPRVRVKFIAFLKQRVVESASATVMSANGANGNGHAAPKAEPKKKVARKKRR